MASSHRTRSTRLFLATLALSLLPIAAIAGSPGAAEAAGNHHSGRAGKGGAHFRTGLDQASRVKVGCRRGSSGSRREQRRQCLLRRSARSSTVTPSTLYWGASIGSQLTGTQAPWDMNATAKFEAMAGKPLSLVNFFAPFSNCATSPCTFYKFPTRPMESIRSHGAIPVFSWSSQSIPSQLNEPDYQLSDVINGTYDAYIREFAEAAHQWGHPFFLRFNWEMNGNWFPWSEGVNGNSAGEYVAAWRHVHDIFTSVGATNVSWVWCPNIDPGGNLQSLDSLYPGDSYVDWTGLDGYNWGTNPAKPDHWQSFDQLYSSTYHEITDTIAPSKPMIIGEVGSTESGGSKANWIQSMLSQLPVDYPKIRGMLWFDTFDNGMDWPIETSSSATEAFASGIQAPSYLPNDYATLAASPIPPPS